MAWRLLRQPAPRDATGAVTGLPWAQWVDSPQAEGWLAALRAALAQPPPRAVTRDTLPAAGDAVWNLWTALSGFLRAIDLPAAAFDAYALGLAQREGGAGGMLGPAVGDWGTEAQTYLAASDDQWSTAGQGADSLILVPRVWLMARTSVLCDPPNSRAWLLAATPPDPPKGAPDAALWPWRDGGCADAPPEEQNLWLCATWLRWLPGWGSADQNGQWTYLVPLQAYWDWGAAMAQQILADGITGTLARSTAYVAAKNALTAAKFGVRLPGQLPAVLAGYEASAKRPDDATRLIRNVGAVVGPIAATALVALQAAPPVGQITTVVVGALLLVAAGLGYALESLFGTATAYEVDVLGRREPVLEEITISGQPQATPPVPPTHVVPDPPRVGGSTPAPSPWLTSLDCLAHHGTWDGAACAGGDPARDLAAEAAACDAAYGVWDPVALTCGPPGSDVNPGCPAGTTWDGTRCVGPGGAPPPDDRLHLPPGHPAANPPPAAGGSPLPLLAALFALGQYL